MEIEFALVKILQKEVFNLWKEWPLKPSGGMEKIPAFTELLEETLCSNNRSWFLYLWGWLAHMIQLL